MARAVVVGGVRTPFHKAFGELVALDTIALGAAVVRALLRQYPIGHHEIDSLVWGGVILPPGAPNVGREIVLDLGLPPSIEAMTVTRACASGLQAVTSAAAAIERGEIDVAIAGGSDSTSNASITMPPAFVQKLGPVVMGRKATPGDYLRAVGKLDLSTDLLPRMPRVAERTTGLTMGQSAESMAERNGISRQQQDEFALGSHRKAAAAVESGWFAKEMCPVTLPDGREVHGDGLIRGDTSLERLSALRPAFKRGGTITAGNASPLTDGAAAVLLMSEDKARSLGLQPLARVVDWAYVGVDPTDQLLIGPALAIPKVLDRVGLPLERMDRIDLHEAFAAQVLSVVGALQSKAFAQARLGRDEAFGTVDPDKLNVYGGSLSIGHPFGATGARMVTTMARELARGAGEYAVLGICAAGGLGAAALLQRV